jgi:hypothetical protein
MCFSAEASFAGGAMLSVIGIASSRNISRTKQRLFAAIPLIFALQQFAEIGRASCRERVCQYV